MEEFASQLGRFGTTARLFSLVEDLPKDKQLILLKQLLGERITTHLFQLVIGLADGQRQRLLEQLMELPFEQEPVTTVHLDEEDSPMRQIQRKACELRAVGVLDAGTFDGTVTDISTVGMFVKTNRSFPTGKPLRISFRLPGLEKPLILNGEILRSETSGIGVRLLGLTAGQEKAIQNFISARP